MDNLNLPAKRSEHSLFITKPAFSGVLTAGSVLGVIFTSYDLLFIALAILGILFFAAGNLINKSLVSTQSNLGHPDPLLIALKSEQHKIAQTKYMVKVSSFGEKAHQQTLVLEERWKQLKKVIESKFSPGELTYSRYMNASEESVHLILQNFSLLGETLKSMEMMNIEDPSKKAFVLELLNMNDSALTELGSLADNLVQLNAGGSTDSSMEHSINELKRLADQAKKYSK